MLLHIDAVYHKPVRGLALAVDRKIARVKISGWVDHAGYPCNSGIYSVLCLKTLLFDAFGHSATQAANPAPVSK